MHHVFCKLSHIDFTVSEFQLPLAVFLLIEKITLVYLPALLNILIGKYLVVEVKGGTSSGIVIDFTFAMEVVHVPAAIISEATVGIVETPFSMHFVVFPVPFVVAAIFVIKDTSAVSLTIFDLSYVACSHIILNCPLFVLVVVG
jgi:hypothetical protein